MRPTRSIRQTLRSRHNRYMELVNTTSDSTGKPSELLEQEPVIINVGLEGFSTEMQARGVKVVHVDWRPPAGGDPELADLLSRLGS